MQQELADFEQFIKEGEYGSILPANWRQELSDWQESGVDETEARRVLVDANEIARQTKFVKLEDTPPLKLDDTLLAATKRLNVSIDSLRKLIDPDADEVELDLLSVVRVFAASIKMHSKVFAVSTDPEPLKQTMGEFAAAVAELTSQMAVDEATVTTGPLANRQLTIRHLNDQQIAVRPTSSTVTFVNICYLLGAIVYAGLTYSYVFLKIIHQQTIGDFGAFVPSSMIAFLQGYFDAAPISGREPTYLEWVFGYSVNVYGGRMTYGMLKDIENFLESTYQFNLGRLFGYNPVAVTAILLVGSYFFLPLLRFLLSGPNRQTQTVVLRPIRDDDDDDNDTFMDPAQ